MSQNKHATQSISLSLTVLQVSALALMHRATTITAIFLTSFKIDGRSQNKLLIEDIM